MKIEEAEQLIGKVARCRVDGKQHLLPCRIVRTTNKHVVVKPLNGHPRTEKVRAEDLVEWTTGMVREARTGVSDEPSISVESAERTLKERKRRKRKGRQSADSRRRFDPKPERSSPDVSATPKNATTSRGSDRPDTSETETESSTSRTPNADTSKSSPINTNAKPENSTTDRRGSSTPELPKVMSSSTESSSTTETGSTAEKSRTTTPSRGSAPMSSNRRSRPSGLSPGLLATKSGSISSREGEVRPVVGFGADNPMFSNSPEEHLPMNTTDSGAPKIAPDSGPPAHNSEAPSTSSPKNSTPSETFSKDSVLIQRARDYERSILRLKAARAELERAEAEADQARKAMLKAASTLES